MESVKQAFRERNKPYVLLVERIPVWLVIILFVICSVLSAAFIAISFFTPSPGARVQHTYWKDAPPKNTTFASVFRDADSISFPVSDLKMINQELTMNLILKPPSDEDKQLEFSLFKQNFLVSLQLIGWDDDRSQSEVIVSHSEDPHLRFLVCPQRQEKCRSMYLAYLPYIAYSNYELEIKLHNADELYNDGLLDDYLEVEFLYQSDEFAAWTVGWRYALLILALPTLVFLVAYHLARQNPKAWKTEQKLSVVLLLLLVLYDNPIYVLDYIIPSSAFSLINYIFMITFVCYLLYLGLVLSHGIIKRPKDRSFLWFHLPKIVLVGAIWVVALVVLVYTRIQSNTDPAYMLAEDIQTSVTVLFYFSLAVILVYVGAILYYIFRACGFFLTKQLPKRYSPKFVAVFLFIVILMCASVVDVMLFAILHSNNGAQFLSFFVMYNVFSIFLSILFMPTFTVQEKKSMGWLDKLRQEERDEENRDATLSPEEGGHMALEEEDYFEDERALPEEYRVSEDHEWD